jgi:CRISPR-associated endonuclease/helicase Cas3
MLVIAVSECEKKAFTRSRRILNKYLFQYGRRTWMGRLSEEGLEALRAELKAKASRHMAVACHRVVGTRRTELAWVVGTRRHFSPTGEFAFAVTGRDVVTPLREKTMPERLVGHMAHLAGLLHDLGKAVSGFQAKLRQNHPAPDAIRHDLLSALILLRLLGLAPDGKRPPKPQDLPPDQGEGNWPGQLADADRLCARLDELAAEAELFPAEWLWERGDAPAALRFLSPEVTSGQEGSAPLLRWLLWLMTSHHRRPHGRTDRKGAMVLPTAKEHIRREAEATEDFRRLAGYPGFWSVEKDGPAWLQAVAETAGRLQQLIESPGFDAAGLFPLMEAHARPALLLADQLVSSEKKPGAPLGEAEHMLANTADGQSGQELADHLKRIGPKASHLARLSLHATPFPAVEPDELPEALRQEPKPARTAERFRWQDRARLAVREYARAGIREGGGFYLLMAGTGRGKTLGIPKLLSELSPGGLRYSLGLGLRTLTLQSGKDYEKKVGFTPEQMATLVGSPLARQLFELDDGDGAESAGYARVAKDSLQVAGYDGAGLEGDLRNFFDPKRRRLVEAPVTVSTVDHLLGPLVERGTGSAAVHLRLMSTDLALDEIDQYDNRDLINIGKLVHLAGVYGRKVVLASATLPPAIAEHFYAAYRAGWQAYCRRVGQEAPLFAGWVADETAIRQDLSDEAFAAAHAAWAEAQTAALAEAEPARRAALVDVGGSKAAAEDLRPLFRTVTEKAHELHGHHHVVIDGRRVSLGLVRWMNVAMCREYARYLVDEAETGADLRVVCYHAHHIPATRYEIERTLDDLLDRNCDLRQRLAEADEGDLNPDAEPGLYALNRALEEGRAQDLLVVVSATTVEDTGRDHDFDWAVWEPNDIRSAPQTAGRVFRHRPGAPVSPEPNVAILRRNWRSAVDGDGTPFSKPGPEGSERVHSGRDSARPRPFRVADYGEHYLGVAADPGDFGLAGPAELFGQRLDAQPAIRDAPLAALADLEHDRLRWLLGPRREETDFDGLAGYIRDAAVRATDFHVRASPFRGGPDKAVEYALTFENHLNSNEWPWQRRATHETEFGPAPNSTVVQEPPLANRQRLLLPVPDHGELIRKLARQLPGETADRIRDLSTIELVLYPHENPNRLVLHFDPDLGGRRARQGLPILRSDGS